MWAGFGWLGVGHPLLLAAGSYLVFRILATILAGVSFYMRVYRRPSGLKEGIRKAGKWAVVTGSTGGIGREFVNQLAQMGMDIVLVSRSIEKLNSAASEIENKFQVKTMVIQADAIEKGSSVRVVEELKGMDIGILVNNVGVNTETGAGVVSDMTDAEMVRMINANTGPTSILMNGFLPEMVKKNKGYIINISSSSGYFPVPYQALYCATKSYINMLTKSVVKELEGSEVKIYYIYPQFVRTNMTMGSNLIHNAPFWTLDPEFYVKSVLNHFGTEESFAGYWTFEFMAWFAMSIPQSVTMRIIVILGKFLIKHSKNIRETSGEVK